MGFVSDEAPGSWVRICLERVVAGIRGLGLHGRLGLQVVDGLHATRQTYRKCSGRGGARGARCREIGGCAGQACLGADVLGCEAWA